MPRENLPFHLYYDDYNLREKRFAVKINLHCSSCMSSVAETARIRIEYAESEVIKSR